MPFKPDRPRLLKRAAIVRALRAGFEAQGFTEVETSALQRSPGAGPHMHALATTAHDAAGAPGERLHLRTSPEFAAKKLVAAGERRIFELARVWRDRERGPLHSPEFTMLEWYRADAPYTALMDDAAAVLTLAADAAQCDAFRWRGRACDPRAEPERLTVAQALRRELGVDLLDTLSARGEPDRDALAAQAKGAGLRVAEDDGWGDVFSRLMVEVEPRLGIARPTILCEYPAPEAALARRKPGDARLAERFELYCCGVELANAFGELTDANEQRARFEADEALRMRLHADRHPIDEALLAALPHMPPTSGMALGLDRLVMLATGAEHIDEVLWEPSPLGDSPLQSKGETPDKERA